jgi:carboxylesterase
MTKGWDDWLATAEQSYLELSKTADRVVVAGLSMGGTLAVELAATHPEIAGIIVINPYIDPPAPAFRELLQRAIDAGQPAAPSIGSDVADRSVAETGGYDQTPLAPVLSLCAALDELVPRLSSVTCPLLLMTSREDHVVPTVSSEILAAAVSGPVEHIWLERSYHVATLDYDRAEVERRAVDFACAVVHVAA